MTKRQLEQYSVLRFIREGLSGGAVRDGLEAECSQEVQRGQAHRAEGAWLPYDVLFSPARRDLSATTFGSGGGLVATNVEPKVIELLRNRMVTRRLGCTVLDGLTGSIAIPRQTAAATVECLPESGMLTAATQSIDQILLSPHRVGGVSVYTRQLVLQSSVSVENFVRDDLLKQVAIKWDRLVLEGTGSNSEPTGILNTQGIGSVTFDGSVPTWKTMLSFEKALAVANADVGAMAYVTSPTTKTNLKAVSKIANSTFPIFIWEDGKWSDGSGDGTINSYRAASTNQISNDAVVFGHWADAVLGIFGSGVDLLVNPFSLDTEAKVRVTANSFIDSAVRHSASFVWSDSGAVEP
jgi:HK97 family phage major capsid protein